MKKFLIICLKGFLYLLGFILTVLASHKSKKVRGPTTEEILSGERIIGSDKYFFPDQDNHK